MIYYLIFGVFWLASVAIFISFIAGAKKLSGKHIAYNAPSLETDKSV